MLLVVIPARGGSRRVPRKNIALLRGKPLVEYTIDAALQANVSPHVVVSTDDVEIADIAHKAGGHILMRPAILSTDTASTEGVILHALDHYETLGVAFEWVMTLPPTSPLRSARTIQRFAQEVQKNPDMQDCLMSIHENRGDFWIKQSDDSLRRLFPEAPRRQQDRAPLWEENSAVYVTRASALRSTSSVLGLRVRGLVIDPVEAHDINTKTDLMVAEALLASPLHTNESIQQ